MDTNASMSIINNIFVVLSGDKSNERIALGQRLGRGDTEGLEASTRDDIVEFLQKQTSAPSGGLRESEKVDPHICISLKKLFGIVKSAMFILLLRGRPQ